MWARIGVKAQLAAENFATYSQRFQNSDTSLYMLGWGVAPYNAQYAIQSLVRIRDEVLVFPLHHQVRPWR